MVVKGEIEILKALQAGGQKEVFLVKHNKIGMAVLKCGKCFSSISLERIKREIEILRGIDSKYYPKNFYFQYDEQGRFEILEEFIEGMGLAESKQLFTTEEKVALLLMQLVEGMECLWDKKIVHRDLKPDNIIIRLDGRPVIIDLGIARDLEGASLTKTIYAMGPCTPIYASPEQLQNKKNLIDVRSDFFSLGIIISELFLEFHPFTPDIVGEGTCIEENIIKGKYSLQQGKKQFSNEMIKIINKMLAVQPYNRYRNNKQLYEDIAKFLKGDKYE